ncbi:MAG: molybdenum cofactor biosynthesis protein MoaE [Candidatus Lokiarchaeota archaeon]|nr:molybdenum cofactor biosynthesis protein MoaE [Candidatus Lokiarchaeota archaeon]
MIEVNNPNKTKIESGIYNKGEIDLEHIIQSVKKDPKFSEAGSVHTFTGMVRCSSKTGKPVIGMKIDAYNDLANESIRKICNKLKQEKGIIDIKIIHLKGEFELSEDLVYVVVASAHRKEGFETISKAVDMYKKEIAVWKREDFKDGSSEWI